MFCRVFKFPFTIYTSEKNSLFLCGIFVYQSSFIQMKHLIVMIVINNIYNVNYTLQMEVS